MRQCQQLYARGNVLLRKFHMCSMDVKVKLFRFNKIAIQGAPQMAVDKEAIGSFHVK